MGLNNDGSIRAPDEVGDYFGLAPIGGRFYVKPDSNSLFHQAIDSHILAKFERPWHYAWDGRGALRRVWVAALPTVAGSA